MAFGEIIKQSAKQALGHQVSEALSGKPSAQGPVETTGSTILGQVQAMQKALREDQELAIFFDTGTEQIRLAEIYAPAWQVLVLTGLDSGKNLTRIVSPADSTRLICKVLRVQAPAVPTVVKLSIPPQKA